jgi:hypothetical protein
MVQGGLVTLGREVRNILALAVQHTVVLEGRDTMVQAVLHTMGPEGRLTVVLVAHVTQAQAVLVTQALGVAILVLRCANN